MAAEIHILPVKQNAAEEPITRRKPRREGFIASFPAVGVSRDTTQPCDLVVSFRRVLTDDELREFHRYVGCWSPTERGRA